MKLPKTVTVFGEVFKLRLVKDLSEDGKGLDGHTDLEKRIISIDKHVKNRGSVLIHEVLHAVLDVTSLNQLLKEENEEAIILSMEKGIVALLKEHGDIILDDIRKNS